MLRSLAVVLLAAVLVSTAAPALAQAPSPSPGPSASANPIGVPIALDLEELVVPVEAFSSDEEGVAEANAELVALLLEESGLADALDPDALAMVTALLTGAGAGEWKPAAAGPTAAAGTRYMRLAASTDGAGSTYGGAAVAAAAGLMGAIEAGYERDGTTEPPAVTERGETEHDGVRTNASSRSTIRVSKAGSKIVVDASSSLDGTQTNVATGAQVGRFSERTQIHAEVDGCPDADGIAEQKLSGEMTIDASGMPGGGGFTVALDRTRRGHVGEDAYLRTIDETSEVGIEAAPTGGGPVRRASAQGNLSHTRSPASGVDPSSFSGTFTVADNPGGFTDAEITGYYKAASAMLTLVSELAFDRAQKQWRDGACVRIESTEASDRDVEPSEQVTISAKPMHKLGGTELEKPVVGSLAGEGELDPADTPQDAPASLSYTAADEEGKSGTVTLTSTSNRGIGTLVTTFRVNPARYELTAKGDFTLSGLLPFADLKGKISAKVRDIKAGGGDSAGSGSVRVQIKLEFDDSRLKACALSAKATGGVMVVHSPRSAPEERTVRIKLDVRDQIDQLRMTCSGVTQAVPLEGEGGLGHFWSEPLAEVVFPLEGGRKAVSGSKSYPSGWRSVAKGTLTLRKQPS